MNCRGTVPVTSLHYGLGVTFPSRSSGVSAHGPLSWRGLDALQAGAKEVTRRPYFGGNNGSLPYHTQWQLSG